MIAGNCLCMSALALKILSEENTGDQKKLRLVSFPSYVWNFYLMKISDGCLHWKWFKGIVSKCQPSPENSVGRKYERSEEAAFVYSVPKCVALLSDEHTWWVSELQMIQGDSLCMSALALKILLEGNTGDQKRLRLFSLSLNVYNCYLMNILDGCLCLKWFKGEVLINPLGEG